MVNIFRKFHFIKNFPEGYPFHKKVYANLIYFSSRIILDNRKNLLTKKDMRLAKLILRRGDILLLGNLRDFSSFLINSPITHSAIHTGRHRFVHAVGDGVESVSLKYLGKEYDTLAIVRVPKKVKGKRKIVRKAVRYAKSQIGKPFDFDFSSEKDRFFCSKLVHAAYHHADYDTNLQLLGKCKTWKEKIKEIISTAHRALHPDTFPKGNFKVVFLSEKLSLEGKKFVLKK